MRERDISLDVVKGVAILIVMLGHCLVWNQMAANDPYIYDMIATVQMPLFMGVSGYLAGMARKKRSLKEMGSVIGRRAMSYLIPFFVWPLLLDLMHPLRRIKELLFQLDTGLWFLMTLFIVSLVSIICEQVSFLVQKKQALVYLVLALVFYGLFFLQGRSGFELLSPSLTVNYMPFFVICYVYTGFIAPTNLWQKTPPDVFRTCALVCGLTFFLACMSLEIASATGFAGIAIKLSCGFYGVVAIFYGAYHIEKDKPKKWLAFVGQYTLELYVCQYVMHGFFVRVRNLGDATFSPYTLKSLGIIILTFIIMCVFSALLIFISGKVRILALIFFGKRISVKK